MEHPLPLSHVAPSNSSEEENKAESFAAVLSVIDKESLSSLAAAVLQRIQPHSGSGIPTPSVGEPLYGSYHVLFPLTFETTGLRWLAKIPINGVEDKWDTLSAMSLVSEANTMRLLKRETTIPLPEVIDFSSSTESPIGCPYILIEFISGIPLYDLWFTNRLNGTSADLTRERRTRALKGIADSMVQLGKFSFSQFGSPLFKEDGNIGSIGPMRCVDHQAMLERWFIDNDPNNDPIYVQCEASSDNMAYSTFMLGQHPEPDPTFQALEMLSRRFINQIPDPEDINPFVLAHPDFDIQNFIVSEDGELVGIIDWDGVSSVPRCLGNERYPGWLTRDWDEGNYGYTDSMEEGVEPEGVWEDSPESLSYYRGVYNEFMVGHRARVGRAAEPNLTRMSLISEDLAIAGNTPQCRTPIIQKIAQESWIAAGRGDKLDVIELAISLADDGLTPEVTERMRILQRGFDVLLLKEGL